MSVMSIANQHSVASSYANLGMARQLRVDQRAMSPEDTSRAAQQVASTLVAHDESVQASTVSAAGTRNRTRHFEEHPGPEDPFSGTASGLAGSAGGSGALEPDTGSGASEQTGADLSQTGGTFDLYL